MPPLHAAGSTPTTASPEDPLPASAPIHRTATPQLGAKHLRQHAGAWGGAAERRTASLRGAQKAAHDASQAGRASSAGKVAAAPATNGLALRIERRHNPRLLGALAYAVPLLPALALLLRERRNRFVRAHAAQSLTFFAGMAVAQVALYALLVLTGGQTTNLRVATVLAVVFAVAWLLVAAVGFVAWARLVAAALAGRVAALPLVTPLARGLLRGFDRIAAPQRGARNDRQSGIVGASGGRQPPRRITFD